MSTKVNAALECVPAAIVHTFPLSNTHSLTHTHQFILDNPHTQRMGGGPGQSGAQAGEVVLMKRYRTINVRADAGPAASGHHHTAHCQASSHEMEPARSRAQTRRLPSTYPHALNDPLNISTALPPPNKMN